MSVRLRKRKLRNGAEQYYFDVYDKGRREYPTLKEPQLIIQPSKDKATLKANAEVLREAERIVKVFEGELAAGKYKWLQTDTSNTPTDDLKNASFLEYFRAESESRRAKRGCKSNTYSCFRHFERFVQASHRGELTYQMFTQKVVEDFKRYLDKLIEMNRGWKAGIYQPGSGKRGINANCAIIYFKRLKMVSAKAFKAGLLSTDASSDVENFRPVSNRREYLEAEEVHKLAQDLEANPVDSLMKRAFLFGCNSGLRWEDLTGLTWKDIQGGTLSTEIRKSKGKKRLDFKLSDMALDVAGKPGLLNERIFPLTYNMYLNVKLDRWILANGIQKKITWHCARHTFATVLLDLGQDISLVQRALAHSRLETTQIYAKILDKKLNEATSSIGEAFTTVRTNSRF